MASRLGFDQNKMDENIMEYVYGLEALVGTGIVGLTVAKLTEKVSGYIQKKICERWERYYEENLHEIVIVEVEKERGRNGFAEHINYSEEDVEYAKMHHKRREQLEWELENQKAIYRAQLDRELPFTEMPKTLELVQ